ncbi:hypothetical protein [Streptomyces beihaiensis]|uniref:Uncharacterized protein n=1 Tax=Streptomyces beihaiensis TaxID=2984495 RepID=A0ABT3TMX6_9ACTN|nr:hypothetical protein [Streptomyces beihaiensis]MCX3058403.1 hypothetical protein [Streptomyces beihaiensis]
MIAAVGHADLSPDALRLMESELAARVRGLPSEAYGLVRASAGLPVVFARAIQAAGRRLAVLIPTFGAVPAPLSGPDLSAAGELLMSAGQVRLLAYDPGDRDACVRADEQLVDGCSRLLAVWDGSPSDGRDATAHLVAYARARGIPVDVLWPAGAARRGDGGAR